VTVDNYKHQALRTLNKELKFIKYGNRALNV